MRGVHSLRDLCDWCNDGGLLTTSAEHLDGRPHHSKRSFVPHYRVHALLAAHPDPVPAMQERQCWVNWVATRWLAATELPAAARDWFFSSTLWRRKCNTILALAVCDALASVFPRLALWHDVLTGTSPPSWVDVSDNDYAAYVHALRHPSLSWRGMEVPVAEIKAAVKRCVAVLSDSRNERPLLDAGALVGLQPSATLTRKSVRELFRVRVFSRFGARSDQVSAETSSTFVQDAVALACRAPCLEMFSDATTAAAAAATVAVVPGAVAAAAASTAAADRAVDDDEDGGSSPSPACGVAGRGDGGTFLELPSACGGSGSVSLQEGALDGAADAGDEAGKGAGQRR